MDRIETFRMFARVAELRSFTRAAESLGVPKASVSTRIGRLENELGARLLQRTTRQVQLTHEGMAFYERVKDLISDADELQSMFQAGPADLSGRIRVDMSSRMARFFIIPRLPEFVREHPGIQIELGSTDREVDLIREGYDLVIRGGALADSSLISRKLGETRILNLASPAYLKERGTPRSLKDLDRHFLVHYVTTFGEKPEGFEYFDGERYRSIAMRGLVTVGNAEAYVAACEAGLGIIQQPGSSVREQLESGKLVRILPKFRAEPIPIYLVYPHRRNLPRRVKAFMDWVESVLREAPEFA